MTELIDRSQKCTIDDSFSGSRKARSLDFNEHLTGAICATKQVVLNASPGAAFEDLGSLATTSSWIPSWTIPEVQEAMEVVMQFAEILYQSINMNPSVALTMAAFVFMLVARALLVRRSAQHIAVWLARSRDARRNVQR